jgi:hypothetical protein
MGKKYPERKTHKLQKQILKDYICFCCGRKFKSYANFHKPYRSNVCCGWECFHKVARDRAKSRGAIHEKQDKFNVLYECKCKDGKKLNHHFDYTKPFDVIRLCRSCHRSEHERLKKITTAQAVAI